MKTPYVVYTGNLYPHKNISVLIRAVDLAKVNLAIVCARSVFKKRLPISPRVNYMGRLSDEQLVSLYQNAVAFTFPSLIEGFGLPGLEAMATGLPVIAARASCLPEIYGDAALFFDPHDPVDLADKIRALLIDKKKLRESLIARGQMQVKKYSWSKMAAETWSIYQSVLK